MSHTYGVDCRFVHRLIVYESHVDLDHMLIG